MGFSVPCISDGDHIPLGAVETPQVGIPALQAEAEILVGAHIVHGRLGPAAVVAQNGNRMGDALSALFCGHGFGKGIALDVSACRIVPVQINLLFRLQRELDMNLAGGARLERNGVALLLRLRRLGRNFTAVKPLQEQVNIICRHQAVAVPVCLTLVKNGSSGPGDIVQQGLAV